MLLDTHVWVWAAERNTRRLGRRTLRAIERAHAQDSLHVSTASIFEIAALYVAGRLLFSTSADRWIRASIETSRIRVLDVSTHIAIDAGSIPATALADPFDRLIAATAVDGGLPLVTLDQRILAYAADTRGLTTVDARH